MNANEQEDDLEVYMKNVSDHLDASKKTELKQNLHALRKVSVVLNIYSNIHFPETTGISVWLRYEIIVRR